MADPIQNNKPFIIDTDGDRYLAVKVSVLCPKNIERAQFLAEHGLPVLARNKILKELNVPNNDDKILPNLIQFSRIEITIDGKEGKAEAIYMYPLQSIEKHCSTNVYNEVKNLPVYDEQLQPKAPKPQAAVESHDAHQNKLLALAEDFKASQTGQSSDDKSPLSPTATYSAVKPAQLG